MLSKLNMRVTPTRLEWIEEGLGDLVRVITDKKIGSIAVPPLGCGNGGLDWDEVRPLIIDALSAVDDLEAVIYEPTSEYQNVAKRKGVDVKPFIARVRTTAAFRAVLVIRSLHRGAKALGARAHHGRPSGTTPGMSQGRAVMPAQVPAIATQRSDSL